MIILSKSLQMWVFMYRIGKQLYDHTNNGVESKNRIFKYNFLNCSHNLLMSRLLCLLVEMFVPTQIKQLSKFKYLNTFCCDYISVNIYSKLCTHLTLSRYSNEKAWWHPSVAQIYVEGVPDFLRNKAPWFIRHCLAAMERAEDDSMSDIEEYDVMMFKVV